MMDVYRQVAGMKSNDEKVLRYIYTSNFPKVEDFVMRNNGSADDAKDVFQEAFIAAWRNINTGKFEPQNDSALSGYLYQIAKNKWLDHLRALKTRQVSAIETPIEGAPVELEISDEKADYLKAVYLHFQNLGDQCKDLLKRFYFKKESLRDIATAFAWTEASAKNNKYRCLQKLRGMIKGSKNETD